MKRVVVDELPRAPLAAAGVFHSHWLPRIESLLASGDDVMVFLSPADHTHREWRLAIAAGLARGHAPQRVNFVAGVGDALEAIGGYLAEAPAITGQYLEGDGYGAALNAAE